MVEKGSYDHWPGERVPSSYTKVSYHLKATVIILLSVAYYYNQL